MYQHIKVPEGGQKITVNADFSLNVPDQPIIPYIEGDGTGFDITPVMIKVVDAAVERAYAGKKKIHWMEVFAGEKSTKVYGPDVWLPEETLKVLRDYVVSIKGPLTTPVGGGIRSLNVALRQELDLYVCLRPIQYFDGVPSPVKEPHKTNMVIFRENSEDIYAGIEFEAQSEKAKKLIKILQDDFGVKKIRFPDTSAIGVKPVSKEGTERLVRKAIQYAVDNDKPSVTLVHKGNIMKFTEGAFRDWGYALSVREFRNAVVTERESWILGNAAEKPSLGVEENARLVEPGYDMAPPEAQADLRAEVEAALALQPTHGGGKWKNLLKIKDSIADITLQQVLTRAKEFDVIATTNLNGDYLSDALAAQVGGIGIAPGGNINYQTGHAVFEATHGTAPKYANQDKVNPGSVILSGELMFRYLGWTEAADLVIASLEKTIDSKQVTYDLARLIPGSKELKTSEFADAMIENM